jgi:RimJ/RimL family protein N-acetyltransferase
MNDETILRPFREEDLTVFDEILFTGPQGSGAFQWFGWHDTSALKQRWAENTLLGEDEGILLVADNDESAESGQKHGFVSWQKMATARSSWCWRVGIALRAPSRGKGHGTRAQRLLVEYLFANTMAHRIEAGTDAENLAEQRALEKAGFQREGVMRGHILRDGAWRDTVVYGIVRTDARGGDGVG